MYAVDCFFLVTTVVNHSKKNDWAGVLHDANDFLERKTKLQLHHLNFWQSELILKLGKSFIDTLF